MSVSARFIADFSQFHAAVDKAEAQLIDLSKGAATAEKSLNRMVDNFSGRKVIQDATLMSEAVERIGGTSKLTETELKRVGAAATEAVAKLRALGEDIPAKLQKAADAGKPVQTALQKVTGAVGDVATKLGPLAGAIGVGFGVAQVVSFGRAVFETADSLQKVSDKTGIGVEALQRLGSVAADSGNTLEQVSTAVSQMQNRLASGDQSALAALDKVGLSFKTLSALSPDQQFARIAGAVGAVQDPAQRAALAIDFFGKSGAELLPTLRADIEAVLDSTVAMSEGTVKTLDEAGDAWARFWRNLTAAGGTAIASLINDRQRLEREAEGLKNLAKATFDPNTFVEIHRPQPAVGAPLTVPGIPDAKMMEYLNFQMENLRRRVDEQIAAGKRAADEVERERKAEEQYVDAIDSHVTHSRTLTAETQKAIGAGISWSSTLMSMSIGMGNVKLSLDKVIPSIADLEWRTKVATYEFTEFGEGLSRLGHKIPNDEISLMARLLGDMGPKVEDLTGRFRSFGTFLKEDLAAIVVGAFQGGGDVGKSIGSAIGKELTSAESEIGKKLHDMLKDGGAISDGLKKGLGSSFGGALSSALGAALPVLGALAGSLVSAIGGLFHDKDWEKVNDTRDALFEAAGGLSAYHKELVDALGPQGNFLTQQVLAARTTKDYERAVKAASDALEAHNKKLEQARKDIESLGPAFNAIAKAAGSTATEVGDLGVIAVASYGAMRAAGFSAAQALAANHEGLQRLRQAYEDLGGSADNAAVQALLVADTILTNNPALLAAVDGLTTSYDVLSKYGLLNVDTLVSLERQGIATYTRLQAEVAKAGGSTRDALLPMQEYLHEAQDAAEKLGVPLDDNTQLLINQSKELGIWKDKGKDANELLLEGLTKLVAKFDEFLDRIGRVPARINTEFHADYTSSGSQPDYNGFPNVVPMARGGSGRVTKPTLFMAGEAGAEDYAFSGGGRQFGRDGAATTVDIPIVINLDGDVLYRGNERRQTSILWTRRKMDAA